MGKGLHPAFDASPIVGGLADAISTHVAINRGGREANPVMAPLTKSWPVWYAAKLALGVGFSTAGHLLAKSGRRRAGKALDLIAGAFGAGAAVHNLRQR